MARNTLYLKQGPSARAARMAPPASFALRNPQRQQIIDASKELGHTGWRMLLDGNDLGTTPSLSEAYDLLNAALDEVAA